MAAMTGMPAFPSSADRTRISRHSRTQSDVFGVCAEGGPVQEHGTYAVVPSLVSTMRTTTASGCCRNASRMICPVAAEAP